MLHSPWPIRRGNTCHCYNQQLNICSDSILETKINHNQFDVKPLMVSGNYIVCELYNGLLTSQLMSVT